MSYFHPAWLEHQRRRDQRHDRQRLVRSDAHRFMMPGPPEAKSRAGSAEHQAEAEAAFIAELEALRADHERVRIELADVKLTLALRRIFHKYSPNQPRVPAGSREGGQWINGDGANNVSTGRMRSAEADDRVALPTRTVLSDATPDPIVPGAQYAQNTTPSRYSVDLHEEEARGGHTLREHVGKSDEELMSSVRTDRGTAGIYRYARARHGSFDSQNSANDFVNRTLERNQNMVDLVASGRSHEAFLKERFGYPTGREAFRPGIDAEPYLRDTYEVGVEIRYDPISPRGYRVHTAYPRNEQPR